MSYTHLPSRQDIVVECLLLIHVVHRSLEQGNLLQQHLALLRQNDLALGNGIFALEAQLYIMAHLLDAEPAALQTAQTLDPGDVLLVKYPM